jgi:DNA-binding transcriptional LysR family regulator
MTRAGVELVIEHDVEHPHHVLALEAAAAGLGLALAEKRLVEHDLAAGRLIAPFGFIIVPGGLRATISPHAEHKKVVRLLLAWLTAEAQ